MAVDERLVALLAVCAYISSEAERGRARAEAARATPRGPAGASLWRIGSRLDIALRRLP